MGSEPVEGLTKIFLFRVRMREQIPPKSERSYRFIHAAGLSR
jgi:hypothetical protein